MASWCKSSFPIISYSFSKKNVLMVRISWSSVCFAFLLSQPINCFPPNFWVKPWRKTWSGTWNGDGLTLKKWRKYVGYWECKLLSEHADKERVQKEITSFKESKMTSELFFTKMFCFSLAANESLIQVIIENQRFRAKNNEYVFMVKNYVIEKQLLTSTIW